MAALAGLAVCMATPALAEWRGIYFVTSVSPACIDEDIMEVGESGKVRFRFPNLAGNNNTTRISMVNEWQGRAFARNGPIGLSPISVVASGVFSGPASWSNSTARIISRTPSSFTSTTQTGSIVYEIANMDGFVGCTVRFQAGLTKRP
ncbi:MAG: hypothetical protein MUC58_11915 [Rhizobiaceae bacterium]|nr:hypothetical protein [Rhizobiaceae bacterium]